MFMSGNSLKKSPIVMDLLAQHVPLLALSRIAPHIANADAPLLKRGQSKVNKN